MRHHKNTRILGRNRNQRKALIKSLMYSLLVHEHMVTTLAKAKEMQSHVEKLVTKGKVDSLSARRLVYSRIGESNASRKLFDTISPKYKDRTGGYTRITRMPRRKSDAAEMARIEFV